MSNIDFYDCSSDDGEYRAPPITLMPGYEAQVSCGGGYGRIDITCEEMVPDADGNGLFPDGIGLDIPEPKDDLGIAMACWAAKATSDFHEALEFIRLNGERLAVPHPGGRAEEEMWAWLYDKMYDMAVEYRQRWPVSAP